MASRQREHQKKLRERGLCVCCGKPAEPSTRKGSKGTSTYCVLHLAAARERQHKKHDSRRNLNAPSYKSEAKLAEIVEFCPFDPPEWAKEEVKKEQDGFVYMPQGVDGR